MPFVVPATWGEDMLNNVDLRALASVNQAFLEEFQNGNGGDYYHRRDGTSVANRLCSLSGREIERLASVPVMLCAPVDADAARGAQQEAPPVCRTWMHAYVHLLAMEPHQDASVLSLRFGASRARIEQVRALSPLELQGVAEAWAGDVRLRFPSIAWTRVLPLGEFLDSTDDWQGGARLQAQAAMAVGARL